MAFEVGVCADGLYVESTCLMLIVLLKLPEGC